MPACGPKRSSSVRMSLPSRSRLHLHDLRRLDRQRGRVRRRDHCLPHARNPLRQHLAAARVELREDVVEEEEWCGLEQLRLREEEREDGEALLALRAELAKVAVGACDRNVVEVRADPGCSPLDVTSEPSLELGRGRWVGRVPEPCVGQPQLIRALFEQRGECLERQPAGDHELGRENRCSLGPRLEGRAVREAELNATERSVSLGEGREVVLRDRPSGGKQPRNDTVEVGTPGRRSPFDDREPVGREDERRELAAK